MWGGGGMGGGFGGPANRGTASGLPFAGMPSEMVPLIEKLLKDEPEYEVPEVDFSQHEFDRRPVTLRRLFAPVKWSVLGVFLLIVLETVAGRLGPLLTALAIDKGMGLDQLGNRTINPSRDYLYAIVALYFVLIGVSIVVGLLPDAVGRQAQRGRDLPLAGAGVLPFPTAVPRLLHRRAGRSADDPHDGGHREPSALPAGGDRPARRPGPHPARSDR